MTNSTRIESLGLSVRAENALLRNGITTLGELRALPESELNDFWGVGKTVMDELRNIRQTAVFKTFSSQSDHHNYNTDASLSSFMSARTSNALARSGINTVEDLLKHRNGNFSSLRGIGANGKTEIYNLLSQYKSNPGSVTMVERPRYSFMEYLSRKEDERTLDIFADYYNNLDATLDSVAEPYGLTRERARQLIKRCVRRVRIAFGADVFKKELIEQLDMSASEKTEVRGVLLRDGKLNSIGITRMVAAAIPERYVVFKDRLRRINGAWLVFAEDNIQSLFTNVWQKLKYDDKPLLISDITTLYSLNENMVRSIVDIEEIDGYVTLRTNKAAKGGNRTTRIERYLERIGRSATITEITENTGLTLNQVRGALQEKHTFINVGKSMYDLANRDFEETPVDELAANYLQAAGCAQKEGVVIDYIRKYKLQSGWSIIRSIEESEKIYEYDGYYLLATWELDKIVKQERAAHSIKLEDAILSIINSSDQIYDFDMLAEELKKLGDVTTNPNSVKSMVARLARDKKIKRVWGSDGCYCHL